MTPLSYSPSR
uniref:Uncharacterized protein n=1 Tax=Arundo donax TaxID=35708 RepID=A0A0A8ZGT5_ARUDO